MMFADDVVLCAKEKDVLELELEQWMESLGKRGMKVSIANTVSWCLNGRPLGSVNPLTPRSDFDGLIYFPQVGF